MAHRKKGETIMPTKNNTCIIILGMHRSGTSALTGCLKCLGVDLGDSLMPGDAHNPDGYFENVSLYAIHEQLLYDLGCKWDMIGEFPSGWLETEAAASAAEKIEHLLQDHFADQELYALKDPRISRLLPLWKRVLKKLGIKTKYIVMLRNPINVATSHHFRDAFPLQKSLLLWLTHTREPLMDLQDDDYTIVTYEDLVADPLPTLKSMQDDLGVAFADGKKNMANVLGFLDRKNHKPKTMDLSKDDIAQAAPYVSVYEKLRGARFVDTKTPGKRELVIQGEGTPAPATASDDPLRQLFLTPLLFSELNQMLGEYEQNELDTRLSYEKSLLIANTPGKVLTWQVFFPQVKDEGKAYTEERSVTKVIAPDDWVDITLPIPEGATLEQIGLRIDPLNQSGVATIASLKIVSDVTGKEVWSPDCEELRETCQFGDVCFPFIHKEALHLLSIGDDPLFILPKLKNVPINPLSLHMTMKPMKDASLFLEHWGETREAANDKLAQSEQRRTTLAQEHETLVEEKAALAEQLQIAQKATLDLEGENSVLKESVNLAKSSIEESEKALELMEQKNMSLVEEKAALAEQLQIAQKATLDLEEETSVLKESVNLAKSSIEESEKALELMEQKNMSLAGELLSASDAATDLQTKNAVFKKRIEDLENEIESLDKLQVENTVLKNTIKQDRAQANNLKDTLQAQKQQYAGQTDELLEKLVTAETRALQLAGILQNAQNAIHAMETSLTWRTGRKLLNKLDSIMGRPQLQGYQYHDIASIFYDQTTSQQPTAATPSELPGSRSYQDWFANSAALHNAFTETIIDHLDTGACTTPISFVLHATEKWADLLPQTLNSFSDQIYEEWHLHVASDGSDAVTKALEPFFKDTRFIVHPVAADASYNEALADLLGKVTTTHAAIVDAGSVLAKQAAYGFSCTLSQHADATLLYCDSDTIDADNVHRNPRFKPAFSPDVLLVRDYIGGLAMFKTASIDRAELAASSFSPATLQHWLSAQAAFSDAPRHVIHLPFMLYSQSLSRFSEEGVSVNVDETIQALTPLAKRLHQGATMVKNASGAPEVQYSRPEAAPLVSIIVPSTCTPKVLVMCQRVLDETNYPNFEYILVANNISPKHESALSRFAENDRVVLFQYEGKFNYSALNNFGRQHAKGEILVLLNDDIIPHNQDWLWEMVSNLQRPEVGCVGAKLLYGNGTVQHSGVVLGYHGVAANMGMGLPGTDGGYDDRFHYPQNLSAVTAACLGVRAEVFDSVNGLDEELAVAFNDVDFCLRVGAQNLSILWLPTISLYHMESISRGEDNNSEKQARFQREIALMITRWQGALRNDPYYNPNMTLHHSMWTPCMGKPRAAPPFKRQQLFIIIDAPHTLPRSNPFVLSGWVSSPEKIKEITIDDNRVFTAKLLPRMDTYHVAPHTFTVGFEIRVLQEAVKENAVTLCVQHGETYSTMKHSLPSPSSSGGNK
ncbi:MAG: glycosyltransferase [Syntrophotalea acetylenica]|nr:glycosyltransferase [Syntrophotalea acetylenica]